jgi:lysophospholipase-3
MKNFPDVQPSVLYGDGDGTVNLRSLQGYKRWVGRQKEPIYEKQFKGEDHLSTLKSKDVIQYMLDLLLK